MPPEESSYELAFTETLVVRLFGVLESIVLFHFIALQGLNGTPGRFRGGLKAGNALESLVGRYSYLFHAPRCKAAIYELEAGA